MLTNRYSERKVRFLMTITLFLSIGIILSLFLVLRSPKNLHLFEIAFIWMLALFLYEVFISLVTMNLKFFQLSHKVSDTWMLAIQQVIINPILIIWCLGITVKVKANSKKLVVMITFSWILTGIELLANQLNMITYEKPWQSFYSFGIFLVIILTIAAAKLWYRGILQKEVGILHK